jgi:primosomal protein N' (replication factor Y)
MVADSLKVVLGRSILGPEYPPVSRVQTYYIKTILVKIKREQSINKVKKLISESFNLLHKSGLSSSLRSYADVDPV